MNRHTSNIYYNFENIVNLNEKHKEPIINEIEFVLYANHEISVTISFN